MLTCVNVPIVLIRSRGHAGSVPLRDHRADEIVRMRVRDLDACERGQILREEIDAVVDEEASVDLGGLSDETSFEQMLGLVADAGDDRVEGFSDALFVARERDLLLQ